MSTEHSHEHFPEGASCCSGSCGSGSCCCSGDAIGPVPAVLGIALFISALAAGGDSLAGMAAYVGSYLLIGWDVLKAAFLGMMLGRAINESKLNLNPLVEGRSIRLPIPALTEERRKDLVKLVKSQAEEARVRVRGARKAAMDSAKKLKAENIVTEDGQRDLETQIQKLTDKYVKEIDELVAVKEKDIMTI